MKNSKRTWNDLKFWDSLEWASIDQKLKHDENSGLTILPERRNIFQALLLTPLSQVKVVILGDNPYATKEMAMGLAFSIQDGWRGKIPLTLVNIFRELVADTCCCWPMTRNLTSWAKQGVLLLNMSLTVEEGKTKHNKDWDVLISEILHEVYRANTKTVFILWGHEAQKYQAVTSERYVISSVHPSILTPNSRFFGTKPFTRANDILLTTNQTQINWDLNSGLAATR